RVTGDVAGSFDLKIPLSKELNPFVDLNLKFQQNNVMLAQADLPLDVESGMLHYQSSKGLYDTEFDIETLGGKSHLVLTSQLAEDGTFIVSGAFSGDIDAHEVALWRNAPKPFLSRLEGKTNYSGELEIGRSKPGQVDIYLKTDLSGVKLALPAPAAKASSRSVPTDVHITALNDEVLVDVSSQDWLYGAILANSNGLQGGHVSLARPLPKGQKIEKGLSVYGQFDEFDWLTWQPIIEDFKSNLAESSSNDHQSSQVPTNLPEWLRSAELLVDVLPINEKNQLNNVKLSYTRAKDGHPFSVASDEFNAVLNQTEVGPELHIHYLNWLTAGKENKEADKESSLQPNILPSISLKVDQLYIDNRPYGDWSAKVENLGNSLRIKDITTQLPKGQFVGQIFWQGGTKQNVELTIKAEGENARELTKKFSSTPFLSSDRYQTAVLLSWEDSLLSFDRPTLSGKINFNVQKGNFNQVDQLPPFLRLLGIFNVDALAKRLTFDFSDLYEPGMPFDRFSGNLAIAKGQLNTVEPVRVVSPTAEISLQGTANLVDETLN
ncbi:MAG: AsmA-like C-terminal region-containing protein, partial [Pseudomonadota bacterium]|nr:AsmA-like C-terminal region-containing protein [Pseudomonadota bacterium]